MQAQVQEELKSPRLREIDGDVEIWRAFGRYVFLTIAQASELLNRNPFTVQKRFNKLTRTDPHYLNRERQSEFDEWVYFPAPAGGRKMFQNAFSTSPWSIREKAKSHLPHDVMISQFHLKLELALRGRGLKLSWEQWRDDMEDMKPVIPDARFAVEGEEEFTPLENQRARPKNGYKSLIEKMRELEKMDVKRVCWLFPTEERRQNFLEAIEKEFNTTRFWFSTYDLALTDPLGKIWLTPKNYKERPYSILKPTG